MPLNIIIMLLYPIIFCSSPNNFQKSITEDYKENLLRINGNLESLELKLRSAQYMEACLDASNSAKLIKNNIRGLKTLEPNYDWEEISAVLIHIVMKHCPGQVE